MQAPQHDKPKSHFWSHRAKWVGNIAPMAAGIPFFVIGFFLALKDHHFGIPSLTWLLLGVLTPAVALNWLALVGNEALKSDFYARHSRAFIHDSTEQSLFFGAATEGFKSWLDPHEDIGFLTLSDRSIHFYGEKLHFEIKGMDIKGLGWKANPHSLLGLGGFISLTWSQGHEIKTTYLESRDKKSLSANRKHTLITLENIRAIAENARK